MAGFGEGYDYTRGRRPRSAALTARQLRDLLAALFILAGVVGVVAVVFIACPLAGWGVVSTIVVGAGVALGLDR